MTTVAPSLNNTTAIEADINRTGSQSLFERLHARLQQNNDTNTVRGQDNEDFLKLKKLQREMELLEIQETYIKKEMIHLENELIKSKEEILRIQSVPLVIGQFLDII